MQLRFYARGTALVSLPGERRVVGQSPRYVGRILKIVDGAATWPASEEPFACASENAARLIRRCAAGDLLPADEITAARCGVPFVPVEFDGGAWMPAAPAAPKPSAAPVRGLQTKTKD